MGNPSAPPPAAGLAYGGFKAPPFPCKVAWGHPPPGSEWWPPACPRQRQGPARRQGLFSGVLGLRGPPWPSRSQLRKNGASLRNCDMGEHSYHELKSCGPGRLAWRVSFGTADRPAADRGGPIWASAIGGGTFFFIWRACCMERDTGDPSRPPRAARSSVASAPVWRAKGPGFEPCWWRSIFNCWERSDRSELQTLKNSHGRDRTHDPSLGCSGAFQLSERPERLLFRCDGLTAGDRWASLDGCRSRRTFN